MADRIVIMKDGYIQQVGTPSEVYHQPANTFVARFIGAPSMNMLPGRGDGAGLTLAGGAHFGWPDSVQTGKDIVLGVRPEDLQPGAGTPLVQGQVTVREPLGHETLIYVDTPDGEVIAKADGRTPPDIGATVELGADPANLHLFDAETGAALR